MVMCLHKISCFMLNEVLSNNKSSPCKVVMAKICHKQELANKLKPPEFPGLTIKYAKFAKYATKIVSWGVFNELTV